MITRLFRLFRRFVSAVRVLESLEEQFVPLPVSKTTWKGQVLERSEALKKSARVLKKLSEHPASVDPSIIEPADGSWVRKGLMEHFPEFEQDRSTLEAIEKQLERATGSPYTIQDFRSLSMLWLGAIAFQPDLVIEVGRSHGAVTIALSIAARQCPACATIVSLDIWQEPWERTITAIGSEIDCTSLEIITQDARYMPWDLLLKHSKRPMVVIDAHDAPQIQLMQSLIEGLIEPCLNRSFLVFVHDFCFESDMDRLAGMKRPIAGDSMEFCNRLWTGEYYWGYAEVVPLIDWANRRKILLRRPHMELKPNLPDSIFQGLPAFWKEPGQPYTSWITFSHLDLPR